MDVNLYWHDFPRFFLPKLVSLFFPDIDRARKGGELFIMHSELWQRIVLKLSTFRLIVFFFLICFFCSSLLGLSALLDSNLELFWVQPKRLTSRRDVNHPGSHEERRLHSRWRAGKPLPTIVGTLSSLHPSSGPDHPTEKGT